MSRRFHQKLKVLGVFFLFGLLVPPAFAENVDTAWVRRYNGPGNGSDVPAKLVLDRQGNVYITGASQGAITGSDIVTLKYDPDRDLLWERRYNVSGNGSDEGKGITVDENGNVYVTGRSVSAGRVGVTIGYDSSGNQLWAAHFNGSSNDWDELFNIGLDANGNVYVTGVTYVVNPPFSNFFPVVLKYSSNGNYLGGRVLSDGGGIALAVSPDGGTYLGGYTLAKCNSSLTMQWVKPIPSSAALRIDAKGDVYTAATQVPEYDYAVTKLDSGGNQLWREFYNGPGNGVDATTDLEITHDDRFACVTGYSKGLGIGHDYATIRYDSAGNQIWAARYDGPSNDNDGAIAIAVGNGGSVYVTGNSLEPGNGFDIATIKYDSLGNEIWVHRYNSIWDSTDQAVDIAVDSNENIYVAGFSYNDSSNFDLTLVKYVSYLKGDLSGDKLLNLTDVVLQLNCVFLGEGDCPTRIADLNCDGILTGPDVVLLLNMFFLDWPLPC